MDDSGETLRLRVGEDNDSAVLAAAVTGLRHMIYEQRYDKSNRVLRGLLERVEGVEVELNISEARLVADAVEKSIVIDIDNLACDIDTHPLITEYDKIFNFSLSPVQTR